MKNLYQYSAKENLAKFVWEREYSSKGNDVTSFNLAKEKLKTKVTSQLEELGSIINLKAVEKAFNSNGNEEVVTIDDSKGKMVLKEKVKGFNNDEKIKIKNGKVKIRRGWLNETDLKVKDMNGDGDFLDTEDVIKMSAEYKAQKKEEPIVDPVVPVVPEVVETNDTMKGYEGKISALEARLTDSASKDDLDALKKEAQKLKGSINGELEDKLSVAEKKTLTDRIDSLIKRIEAREKELNDLDKVDVAQEAIDLAEEMINDINLTDLKMNNYRDYAGDITAARTQLGKATDAAKGLDQFTNKLAVLKTRLDEKESKVEVYKTGATEKERVEKEYKLQTEVDLKAKDAEIKKTVDAYQKKLEGFDKTPDQLPVDQTPLTTLTDPPTVENVRTGMISHRTESQKMLAEVNFLQTCGLEFSKKVAAFEEEKSELSFANAGRFIASSIMILPGAALDIGLWAGEKLGMNPKKKRIVDYLPVDSRAAEMKEAQTKFETDFVTKQTELTTKKTRLDTYGDALRGNSYELRTGAPDQVRADVQEKIIAQLVSEGVNPLVEPWKGTVDKLIAEFEEEAVVKVQPTVDQLDQQVDGSVLELTDATTTYMDATEDIASYIKTLDIKSPTVLDMSVGFLTKNVGKGLNFVGDGLAKIPVIGFVGGLCRAAGGLVEGVGMMVTDPGKVLEGLGTLVGLGKEDGAASAAWKNMGSALIGGEAWKNGEHSAAIGEAFGNIASFLFTGGAVGAVRGVGIAGRTANMGAKIGKVVGKVTAKVPPSVSLKALAVGRKLSRVGRPLGRAGDFALMPLRLGMKPLKWFNKTKGIGKKANSALTPSKWIKAKPGSRAALAKSERLMKDVAEHRAKLAKLRTQRTTAVGREHALLTRQIAKYEGKITTAVAEARQLKIGTSAAMTRVAKIQTNITRWNQEIALLAGGDPFLSPVVLAQRTAILNGKITRGIAEMARITTLPMPIAAATGLATKGRIAGAMTGTAVAYGAVATAKHNDRLNTTDILEDFPTNDEFVPTPLADIKEGGVDPAVEGGEDAVPSTLEQARLDFEETKKGEFLAFFNTGVSEDDHSRLKSNIKSDLASDVEITIDGVVAQNGIEDVWDLFDKRDMKSKQRMIAVLTSIESKKEGNKNVISRIHIDKNV